jgi:hypothetical protein
MEFSVPIIRVRFKAGVVGITLVVVALVLSAAIGFTLGSVRDRIASGPLIAGTPNRVHVAHYGPIPRTPATSPDRAITVTSPPLVQNLLSDVNRLPKYPTVKMYCPFDDGSYYEVRFMFASGDTKALRVDQQGCQGVAFADSPDRLVAWSANDPRLLNDLDNLFR